MTWFLSILLAGAFGFFLISIVEGLKKQLHSAPAITEWDVPATILWIYLVLFVVGAVLLFIVARLLWHLGTLARNRAKD